MKPDKETKKWFKAEASKEPDKYYATGVLKARGYLRKQCKCGTWFWSVNQGQEHCGDASCAGGFTLFENNPCKREMDYITVWTEFSKMFEKKGYAIVPRYPVVARWNPTMDFTIASIAAFQPHVISGEVEPPAKRLVIPQFCLRFGDVDNVGITMSHMTGFIMVGQHMFVQEQEWDQAQAFQDILDWLLDGLGLPDGELTFHEDAWAGGGNFGPCMEAFSRGVELLNQVYMMFEQDDDAPGGYRPLKIKVLDMGMGHERNAWFSQGKGTIYDATFPPVIEKLQKVTGASQNDELMHKYIPYAAFLNLDEIDDIEAAWERVAKESGIPAETLKQSIAPMTAIYSIAEHARSLLFALADGGLPSNVGGGYNLRVIFRRAQSFIDRYGWDLSIADVCQWHADYLKPLFPELLGSMKDVQKILAVELRKHRENRRRAGQIITTTLAKGPVDLDALIALYDTQGIAPDQVQAAAKKQGLKVHVPENFYALVAEKHEQGEQKTATRKRERIALPPDLPRTVILYFDSYDYVNFEAPVLAVAGGNKVALGRTAFYPTSGGQEHDIGTLGGIKVTDVVKQDGIIIHILEKEVGWKQGHSVSGHIDMRRREQLAQHHTATHIVNGAARKVLGNHVWQAGAAKTEEKGRIDITHYDTLSDKELRQIEEEANLIVKMNLPVQKTLESKRNAEAAHGFRLYQGGAVPGREIRVVEIPGFDVEACGGTHLNMTGEAGYIRILRSTKVQDGIVRIEFTAGSAAEKRVHERAKIVERLKAFLKVEEEKLVPAAAERLFKAWKEARKATRKSRSFDLNAALSAPLKPSDMDPIMETSRILQTQPEHILATLQRFEKELGEKRKK